MGLHKTFFLSRTSPGTFSGSILHKKKSQTFDENDGLTPMKKS